MQQYRRKTIFVFKHNLYLHFKVKTHITTALDQAVRLSDHIESMTLLCMVKAITTESRKSNKHILT